MILLKLSGWWRRSTLMAPFVPCRSGEAWTRFSRGPACASGILPFSGKEISPDAEDAHEVADAPQYIRQGSAVYSQFSEHLLERGKLTLQGFISGMRG
jgi:hypothetical protein